MGNRKPRLHLVHSRGDMRRRGTSYETGDIAPETGIYMVVHSAHRLPHEAVVIQGQRFPKCQKCGDTVLFELLHAAPDLYRHKTSLVFELPVIEEEEDSATA
jgi:hypothetical protein